MGIWAVSLDRFCCYELYFEVQGYFLLSGIICIGPTSIFPTLQCMSILAAPYAREGQVSVSVTCDHLLPSPLPPVPQQGPASQKPC